MTKIDRLTGTDRLADVAQILSNAGECDARQGMTIRFEFNSY